MSTAIIIPEGLWSGDMDGVIAAWIYDDGDMVETETVVAEIMIEKTQIEICAPATGRLRILRKAETAIACGDTIGTIEV